MGKKTAKFVEKVNGWTGDARVYKLSQPLEGYDHVIVSATMAPFSGPETYIFGAKKDDKPDTKENLWKCADWGELDGSFQGDLDHVAALEGAGYEVVE